MNAAFVLSLLLAAPPRLVGQLESRQEVGVFPVLATTEDGDLPPSQTLLRWELLPSVEARAETRLQDFSVVYAPRLLLQTSVGGAQSLQAVTDPLLFHRGRVRHAWRIERGAELATSVSAGAGELDVVRFAAGADDEGPIGGLPDEDSDLPRVALTNFRGESTISIQTGDTESFRLGLRGGYIQPWAEAEDAILSSFELGVFVEYSHYLFKGVDAVFDLEMAHLEFGALDASSRQVALRAGARWSPQRNLTWDARLGALVIVGNQVVFGTTDRDLETVRELVPSGRLFLNWTFLSNPGVHASLVWGVSLQAAQAANAATFLPQVSTSGGFRVLWPAAVLTGSVRAGTSVGDLGRSEAVFLPTFYTGVATLDVPVSRYLGFLLQARGGQRAAAFGDPNFQFGFTEAAVMLGIRLWYSTGRDLGLDQPARRLRDTEVDGSGT